MEIIRLFALLLLLLPIEAAFVEVVDVAPLSETRSLLSRMRYLEDPSSTMSLEQVMESPDWQAPTRSNQGYRIHPVWTMVRLTNSGAEPKRVILRNPRPGVNYLDVYLVSGNNPTRSFLLGSLRPLTNQAVIARHSIMAFDVGPREKMTVLTRIQSAGPIELDWKLSDVTAFSRYNLLSYLLFGFFGGLTITLIFYNLSIWGNLRDNAYAIYSAMAFFSLLFQYALNGIVRVLDIGLSPMALFASGYITSSLFVVAMTIFPIYFFKTIQTMPRMHRMLMVLAGLSGMMVVVNIAHLFWWFSNLWAAIMGGVLLLTAFLLIVTAIRAIRLGLPGARYYLLGQGAYQIAVVIQWAGIKGWIGLSPETEFFIIAATMLDIAFLSLALGSRVKFLDREKNTYQAMSMAQSRFTSLGKAVGAIIHQWKTPLARLGTKITELRSCLAHADAGGSDFAVRTAQILPLMDRDLQDMAKTIDEFGMFYASGDAKASFNPREVINDVLDLLQGKITAARVAVFFEGEWKTVSLTSYPRYFSHVVMTIIDNAIDILAERKVMEAKIRIQIQPHGKSMRLIIEDNGGGIRVNPVSEIFIPFVSHKKQKGSGLGLPIAKMVTEEHLRGKIIAENTRQGARFTLNLPGLDAST